MIELEEVRLDVGGFTLGPLSLRVEAREYLVVLGPSGAGKTLLLDAVAGFRSPSTGSVRLCGRDVTALPPEERRLGWVAQGDALFPHLSVADNLAYGLACRGVPKDERRRRAARLAAELGISSLLERRPKTLSGGERQRVALARALALEPEVILLDEPVTALDPGRRRSLYALLRRLHEERGLTVVHVTHDLAEARTLATRVVVLVNGRVVKEGSAEAVLGASIDPDVADALGLSEEDS